MIKKFAFINQNEKASLLQVVEQHTPPEFYKAFSKYAAGLQTFTEPEHPDVEERIGQLREMFHDFLGQVGLGQNTATLQWTEKVVQIIRPALQKALKNQPSFEDQLQNVPYAQKNQPEQDIATPSDIQDFPKAKPTVIPQNMKLSPGKQQGNLFRSQSTAWQLKEGSMEKDAYDKLTDSLLELADLADEAGLMKQADKMASVLPAIRSLKVAQYEGGQHYWIANGRAFEMAYKKKRMNGKTDPEKFRSPQEVWFEVLQEYQDSLLTNQAEFISKYAGKKYSRNDKAASEILMKAISSRVEKGAAPGVAFYESIRDLPNGEHEDQVYQDMTSAIDSISEAAKEIGNEKLASKAENLLKEAGIFGKVWDWGMGRGWGKSPTEMYEKIKGDILPQFLEKLTDAEKAINGTPPKLPNVQDLLSAASKALYPLKQIINMARRSGLKGYVQDLPNIQYIFDESKPGTIDPKKLSQYRWQAEQINQFLIDNTKLIKDLFYQANPTGMEGTVPDRPDDAPPPPPPAPVTPDKGVQAVIDFMKANKLDLANPADPNKVYLLGLWKQLNDASTLWNAGSPIP